MASRRCVSVVTFAAGVAGLVGCRDFSSIRPARDAGSDACSGVVCPDGSCVTDQDRNPTHCGATCMQCEAPTNATATCEQGKCGYSCDQDFFAPDAYETSTGKATGGRCIPEPPSCRGLARGCGPDGTDACCGYDDVDGTQFSRGYDRSNSPTQDGMPIFGWHEATEARATITDFKLDRYEVTVGRFRKFLDAFGDATSGWYRDNPAPGSGAHPNIARSGWHGDWRGRSDLFAQSAAELKAGILSNCVTSGSVDAGTATSSVLTWLESAPGGPDDVKPMTCVTWHEAFLFCNWDQARLPTEAEWNFAAAGGSEQRAYPWLPGQPATLEVMPSVAVLQLGEADVLVKKVGTYLAGMGRWGQFDLAGNAEEWVYGTCRLPTDRYTMIDAVDPLEDSFPNPVVRGGSYKDPARKARTPYRVQGGMGLRFKDTGWRCARPATQ